MTSARALGWRLLGSLLGALLALALAFAAAHSYAPPGLGAAARNSWLDADFCFAATSSLVALAISFWAGRGLARARALALAALIARALIWVALTILLIAAWANTISLLTLLIAPSHAFACLRLVALAQAFRAERLWRK